MNRFAILASVFALAVGTTGCGNSQGTSNSLVDVGPSTITSASADASAGNLTTLAKGSGGHKGGGTTTTGGGSVGIVMVTDLNGDGLPNRTETITYNVSTTAPYPTVDLSCSQNGSLVLSATTGFYDGYPWPSTHNTMLESWSWTSGAADCTVTLHSSGSSTILAQVKFTAGA
jgi:hypothetical protein